MISTDKTQWIRLMQSMGFAESEDTYHSLIANYAQEHRRYHNLTHLRAVLDRLSESKHLANNPNAVEIALWFHDAIYKIASSSNEKDSADWAATFLGKVGADAALINTVHALIMATEHNVVSTDNDETLIIDIDLSILGSHADIYDEFEATIRQEYAAVPWFIYKRKRTKLLNQFLQRERIFTHAYFFDKLESTARDNLHNAIIKLQSS